MDEEALAEARAVLDEMRERIERCADEVEGRSLPVIARLNKCAEMLGIKDRYTEPVMFDQLRQFVPIIEALTRRITN